MTEYFRALVIDDRDGKPVAGFRDLALADLPDNDVLVEVLFSTLNYKDGLAVSGKGRIARRLPMVAGVDLSGIVVESRNPDWKTGDKVVVNGWGMSAQPALTELTEPLGGFPKGTILAAGNSWSNNGTRIDLYASTDRARTWTFVSNIAQGGRPNTTNGATPIWEPYLL